MRLELRPAGEADRDFCEALTRGNMAAYREARGIAWEPARFAASWTVFERQLLVADGRIAGVLMLLQRGDALEIRDLQLLPGCRGQGIGTWALDQAKLDARRRGLATLRLRVYPDNPARRLYARHGFVVEGEIDGLMHMAWKNTAREAGRAAECEIQQKSRP